MANVLNLDKVQSGVERVIILNGKRHEARPMRVRDFIEEMREFERIRKDMKDRGEEDMPVDLFLDRMINMIAKTFPTLAREELESLTVDQIVAVFEHIQASNRAEMEKSMESEGNLKKATKKKS